MRATWWFALQTLAARRGRTLLLALAVVLSSMLVTAVACALESARSNAHARLDRYVGATDVRVVNRFGASFGADQLERVRALPAIAAVAGSQAGSLTLARPDLNAGADERVRRVVCQARGLDADADEGFRGQEMDEGRLPTHTGEIAIDPMTAKALNAKLGDTLDVQRFGDPIALKVVGILQRPMLGALQRPYVVVARADLVEATGSSGLTTIMARLKPGTDVRAWVQEHKGQFKDPLVLEPSERITTGLDSQERATKLGFALVSVIAFMSAGFIVGTGMTTAVAEQQRQLAVARCVGASRGQVFASQLWAGLALCGGAGLLGVPLGVLAAAGLRAYFHDLLPDGLFISWFGIVLALAGSVAAGVGGALWPAWQAARITPLAALTPHARAPRLRGVAWLALAGAACLAVQLLLVLLPGLDAQVWAYVVAGIPLLHLGWFMLAVPVLWLVGRVLAAPLAALLRLPPGLLQGALAQAPFRLGFTAGALMVGVSILVTTWTNGTAVLRDITERVRISDGFVFKTNGMTVDEQARVRAMPGVQATVPIGYLPLQVVGERLFSVKGIDSPNVVCVGFPPDQFLALNRLDWVQGSPESALPKLRSGRGILVAKEFLVAHGKQVGSTIRLGGGSISQEYEIVGVVGAAGLDVATQFFGIRSVYLQNAVSCVFMDFNEVATRFGSRDAYILQVDMDDTLGPDADKVLGDAVQQAVPGAVFASGRAIRRTVEEIGATVLSVTSTVAFGALLLACIGVGNVVAANISARRFEYGVLRATGASPGLLVRLVAAEVLLVAVAGGMAGTCLGLWLAYMGVMWHRMITGMELHPEMPLPPVLIGYAVLVLLTMAAAWPAVHALVRKPVRALLAH